MAPGACRTRGRSAQKWTVSGFYGSAASAGSTSGSIIWMHRNNGFSTFGWENDFRFSSNFDFQGRIYLKVEITFFEQNQNIDFQGRIYLKIETRIFTKVDQIFDPPTGGPKSPPGVSKSSPGGPKSSPRPLEDTNSIYSNSRSTAKRPLLVYHMYLHVICNISYKAIHEINNQSIYAIHL